MSLSICNPHLPVENAFSDEHLSSGVFWPTCSITVPYATRLNEQIWCCPSLCSKLFVSCATLALKLAYLGCPIFCWQLVILFSLDHCQYALTKYWTWTPCKPSHFTNALIIMIWPLSYLLKSFLLLITVSFNSSKWTTQRWFLTCSCTSDTDIVVANQ